MRNFGIVPSDLNQLQYSEVINQQLYSYYIQENCTAPALRSNVPSRPLPG